MSSFAINNKPKLIFCDFFFDHPDGRTSVFILKRQNQPIPHLDNLVLLVFNLIQDPQLLSALHHLHHLQLQLRTQTQTLPCLSITYSINSPSLEALHSVNHYNISTPHTS